MTKFRDTDAAAGFIASAAAHDTSPQIMQAIAFFARDMDEACALWGGDAIGVVANVSDIWEHATGNGRIDDETLIWDGCPLSWIMAAAG